MNVLIASGSSKIRTAALELFVEMGAETQVVDSYLEAHFHLEQRLNTPKDFELIIADRYLDVTADGDDLLKKAREMGNRARKVLVNEDGVNPNIPGIDAVVRTGNFKRDLASFFEQHEPA